MKSRFLMADKSAHWLTRRFGAVQGFLQLIAMMFIILIVAAPCAQAARRFVWSSDLSLNMETFPNVSNLWGKENLSFRFEPELNDWVMHVAIPAGTYDPGSMKLLGLPQGGAGFKAHISPEGANRAVLSYMVRFPADFDFVRGGKLPGLFGGTGNSGGVIPDGTDGFSFRLMWGTGGGGSVYAYLPTSVVYGTTFFSANLNFTPGKWHLVKQEVVLNNIGQADGIVRMWLDGTFIGEASGLLIRTVDSLKLNGMFFDVFFGGGDPSWASSKDTYIEFANFVFRVIQ